MWEDLLGDFKRLVPTPILIVPSGEGGFVIYGDVSLKGLDCVNAKWESICICLSIVEELRAELAYSWFGTYSNGVCYKDLETISLWGEVWKFYGSWKSKVFHHTKRTKYEVV